MPLTTLDPKTALVVIDLQAGIMGIEGQPYSTADVVARSAELADAFRTRGLPVVLVNVAGAPGVRTDQNPSGAGRELPEAATTLVPELGEADKVVTKRTPGAFTGTDLEAYLRAQGVTQVVVTGVATGNGVAATVQQAFELGFHVTTPLDAMTDSDLAWHEFSVAHLFPKRAETGTTADLLALLEATPA
ncbi:isochorismatase family protein [Nocardioides sp. DS6]|uniref:Isochorismatase family protein n=1 Tax=Nocardioides eburneus TaxID=3231482 RepID=A0ABV3SZ29_9ACTN